MRLVRNNVPCPDSRTWSEAFAAGLEESLALHLDECQRCRRQWSRWKAWEEASRGIRSVSLDPESLGRARSALLVRARAGDTAPVRTAGLRTSAAWPVFGGIAAVAALLLAFWSWPAESVQDRGSVMPGVVPESNEPKTSVVDTGVFTIVSSPVVDVDAEVSTDAVGRESTPSRRRDRPTFGRDLAVPTPESGPATTIGQPSEKAFQEGWAAIRAHRYELAAERFAEVAADAGLAEDATYWRGVALARAGQSDAAVRVLADFVERYEQSPRRAEVAVFLGKLLRLQQEYDRASGYLVLGLLADDDTVQEQARRDLLKLDVESGERSRQ